MTIDWQPEETAEILSGLQQMLSHAVTCYLADHGMGPAEAWIIIELHDAVPVMLAAAGPRAPQDAGIVWSLSPSSRYADC